MDENTNVQSLEGQGTTPEIQEEAPEVSEVENGATAPQEQQDNQDADARDEADNAASAESDNSVLENNVPFLTVHYNHEAKSLTQEEAILLAQRGMKYDALGIEQLHKKLDYAATLSGTDVNSLIDGLIKAPEEAHRKHLVEMYGEDATEDIEIGMEIFRKKQGETYDKIVADRKAATQQQAAEKEKGVQSRLADEYIELKREIPDAPDYAQLPDSVIIEAASGKRDLMSCYLRYLHKENQKINAALDTERAASKATAGSMSGDTTDAPSRVESALMSGLWGE